MTCVYYKGQTSWCLRPVVSVWGSHDVCIKHHNWLNQHTPWRQYPEELFYVTQ